MKERIIVSMTTYGKRVVNIPAVLDTIFAQTMPPDLVVINLAFEEVVPSNVQEYIETHGIELNRVKDTKVYKKIIPTLKKYPDDCIISIDDDYLYPDYMIADFMDVHSKYPDFPISGCREVIFELQCHNGPATLIKKNFFGDYLDKIDSEVMQHCPSDDITFTYFVNKAGYAYLRTKELYFTNMQSYEIDGNNKGGITETIMFKGIEDSFEYLCRRFGPIENKVKPYIKEDPYMADIVNAILQRSVYVQKRYYQGIVSSYPYRLGRFLLKPAYWFRSFIRFVQNKPNHY